MPYTGGFTSAINDATLREERDANTKLMLQELARSDWLLKEAKEERAQQKRSEAEGAKKYATFLDQQQISEAPPGTPPGISPSTLALFGPPPKPPAAPQPPPPGQASVPMMPGMPMANAGGMPGPGMASAMPQPRPPMTPQGGPPGGGMPPPQGAAPPPMAMPPAGGMAPPGGWKPSATAGPALGGKPPGPGGPSSPQVGAPPANPILDKMAGVAQAKIIDVNEVFKSFVKQGADPLEAFREVQRIKPMIDAQNEQRFKELEIEVKSARVGERAAEAEARRLHMENQDLLAKDKLRQQQPLVDARAAKLRGGGGGGGTGSAVGPLKNVEYIYPRTPDGKVDETKPPIGTRGLTKAGKMVVLDIDGNETTLGALAGGTAKESKDSRVGVTNVVRQNIVKSGVTNSLARLDEIEKKFPNMNTSSFFGTSGDNPLTRATYGAGRSMQSSEQKQADAAWASFIDEAIPVFTGGLRGSDAFRRFLIEQAPGPGDDAKSRAEKRRLMRANINGTSKAFFNKFTSDPSFWGPGTKPEEIEEVKGGAASAGDWKVEKVQ